MQKILVLSSNTYLQISTDAVKLYYELQGMDCTIYTRKSPLSATIFIKGGESYYAPLGSTEWVNRDMWIAYIGDSTNAPNLVDLNDEQYNGLFFSNWDFEEIRRDNPFLIEAAEKLGSRFLEEGTFKIIEIPDDVKWHICEMECGEGEYITEDSRTWFPFDA